MFSNIKQEESFNENSKKEESSDFIKVLNKSIVYADQYSHRLRKITLENGVIKIVYKNYTEASIKLKDKETSEIFRKFNLSHLVALVSVGGVKSSDVIPKEHLFLIQRIDYNVGNIQKMRFLDASLEFWEERVNYACSEYVDRVDFKKIALEDEKGDEFSSVVQSQDIDNSFIWNTILNIDMGGNYDWKLSIRDFVLIRLLIFNYLYDLVGEQLKPIEICLEDLTDLLETLSF